MSGRRTAKSIAVALGTALVAASVCIAVVLVGARDRAAEVSRCPDDARPQDSAHAGTDGIDWESWLSINPDVVGWLSIPGTSVDCPVAKAPETDPGYYLDHDVYGEWNWVGCAYLDAGCSGMLTGFATVVSAHHFLDDESLGFGELARYVDREWADEHPTAVIETPSGDAFELDFAGAAVIRGEDPAKRTEFDGKADWSQYISGEMEKCATTGPGANRIDNGALVLVTCSYFNNPGNERTVVYFTRS